MITITLYTTDAIKSQVKVSAVTEIMFMLLILILILYSPKKNHYPNVLRPVFFVKIQVSGIYARVPLFRDGNPLFIFMKFPSIFFLLCFHCV